MNKNNNGLVTRTEVISGTLILYPLHGLFVPLIMQNCLLYLWRPHDESKKGRVPKVITTYVTTWKDWTSIFDSNFSLKRNLSGQLGGMGYTCTTLTVARGQFVLHKHHFCYPVTGQEHFGRIFPEEKTEAHMRYSLCRWPTKQSTHLWSVGNLWSANLWSFRKHT